MNIMIAGGTGFVGKALTEVLLRKGHRVYVLTRGNVREGELTQGEGQASRSTETVNLDGEDHKLTYIRWQDGIVNEQAARELPTIDAVVNLAGESLSSGRWTRQRKQRILHSRLNATAGIVKFIEQLRERPKVLVNASAIGYYGTSLTETFTEQTPIAGEDFLASVVKQWEEEALKATALGVRTVCIRFGLILGKDGGALPRTLLPFKLFAGGPLGSGKQWYSWIHIEDIVGLVEFAIERDDVAGIINGTAPNPVRMKEFGKIMADVLRRPYWLPVPEFMLKVLLGEMSTLLLQGQRVLPKKTQEYGYSFYYDGLREALEDILS